MIERPSLTIDDHPLLLAGVFVTEFSDPLGSLESPSWLLELLTLDPPDGARVPLRRDEDTRKRVRDLLRHGGYKPTGRGKPASEYLVRAVGEGKLASINLAVDACNVASLHSGLPISVVDLDRADPPFRIGIAPAGASYVFNAAGQEIDLSGLLLLFDAQGPCANAVKDAQRTKTHAETQRTLSVVWGVREEQERLQETTRWYRALLERSAARTEAIE